MRITQRPQILDATGSDHAPSLAVSGQLIAKLANAGIRYAVYKNTSSIKAGVAGLCDLDILVASSDLPTFSRIVSELGGVRGYPSPLYDNAIETRHDWFIAAEPGKYVHLDVTSEITVGRKFRKRYGVLGYKDLAAPLISEIQGICVSVVTPHDEARIAILRFAFRLRARSLGNWINAGDELAGLLHKAIPRGTDSHKFQYRLGRITAACEIRLANDSAELSSADIRNLRSAVRAHCNAGPLAPPFDAIIHHGRRISFGLARRITASNPGWSAGKRRLDTGIVVALIGPDGVGKSTQSARLAGQFQRKFRCSSVYLGSNDGSWMKIRQRLGMVRRKKAVATNVQKRSTKDRGWAHTYGSALWRLVIAVQRYAAARRALGLARSGAIVIADRWPQHLAQGMLDGPSVTPAPKYRLAGLLWRLENKLYRAMDKYHPSLIIHIDCTFEASHARKPGDIAQDDFERRIALMREMRQRDPQVRVVDGTGTQNEVTAELFDLIWSQIVRENLAKGSPI